MFRYLLPVLTLSIGFPACAESDELMPVSARVLVGQSYQGEGQPSQIRFINVRPAPVSLNWIAFDGTERPYAVIAPGAEVVQPTYVSHRWLVKDYRDGTALEAFISTRSAARDEGTSQIALIR